MLRRKPAILLLVVMAAACQGPARSAPALSAATGTAAPTTMPRSTSNAEPTVAPTSSATVAPAARSFTEEFEGGLPYWDFRFVDNGQPADPPTLINGFMIFSLPGPDQWAYELYRPQQYEDVRIDAKVEMRLGGQGAAGVVCRYGEQTGWYEFNVYADQTYVLLYGHWLSEGVASYTPLVQAQSEKIDAVHNDIGLLCEGTVLTPFVNGTQLRRLQETTFGLTDGEVGVAAAAFGSPGGSIAYDWVKVSEP